MDHSNLFVKHNPIVDAVNLKVQKRVKRSRAFVAKHWTYHEPPKTLSTSNISLGGWDEILDRASTHHFSISGMAFQDAWSLNLERLQGCCIHVAQPDGRLVPFCAFNLTSRNGRSLYRGRG